MSGIRRNHEPGTARNQYCAWVWGRGGKSLGNVENGRSQIFLALKVIARVKL